MTPAEVLFGIPYFSGLPKETLAELAAAAEITDVATGETIIEEGVKPDCLFVVAEGAFRASRQTTRGEVVLGTSTAGEVVGEMSLLGNRPGSATVRAISPGKVVRIPAQAVAAVLDDPTLLRAMVTTMTARLREREAALVQAEKLASLGTLTAGLLHEVNNPAAALVRASAELLRTIDDLVPTFEQEKLGPLAQSERIGALTAILERSEVGDPDGVAASLVALGWDQEKLEANPEAAVLVHVRQLGSEISLAAERLGSLVGAVKRWTYHDRGERQSVDINQSVIDSVTLLRHKQVGVEMLFDLDPSPGAVEGAGSELGQVVMNLIDNALDSGARKVEVSTRRVSEEIELVVRDNGPGIPEEIRDRIWEPFFTTKPPGVGTGLGLALSERIVSDHGGTITVLPTDIGTAFRILLPRIP